MVHTGVEGEEYCSIFKRDFFKGTVIHSHLWNSSRILYRNRHRFGDNNFSGGTAWNCICVHIRGVIYGVTTELRVVKHHAEVLIPEG